jgi:hypothetical protein
VGVLNGFPTSYKKEQQIPKKIMIIWWRYYYMCNLYTISLASTSPKKVGCETRVRVLKSKPRQKLVFGTEIWFCKPLEH